MTHLSVMPLALRTMLLAFSASFLLAACGVGGTGSPTPTGSPGPSSGPIEHATGETDVVLRFEEGGGFVPLGFLAGQAPTFTLYGDGTIIFRDVTAVFPPADDAVQRQLPYRIARLSEDQVQELLAFAIGPGALGIARAAYDPGNVADAPTAIFTLTAGGLSKTVSVVALGFDNPQSPDAPILKALARVGERLRAFDAPGAQVWTPDRYRGVLTEDAFGEPRAWPWPDIAPADFRPLQLPTGQTWIARTMTGAEVAVLALDDIEGGFLNLVLSGPGDGKTYSLTLRPLLPDEVA